MASSTRWGRRLVSAVALLAAAVAVDPGAARAAVPRSSSPVSGAFANFGCHLATPRPHRMGCFGKVLARRAADGKLVPKTTTAVTGYGPATIQSAYKLSGQSGRGRTVAIVDAYNDPKAAQDLATYRSHFGLPPCTIANGCFRKVNQSGATSPLPSNDYGWALEISLDLDMVSATCPDCKILLVEANSANDTDLYKAVDTAATTSGVVAVSNSYGGPETSSELAADSHFNHPGVAITASSGDSGYGVSYPAASRYVTAVGGTSLKKAGTARGWAETAWSGAGSGCSKYEAKPTWQHDAGCAKRTVADVSAVADPKTGLAVYDTANSCGSSSYCDWLISMGLVQGADGWVQVGGTSASSPIIAAVYALAGNRAGAGYPYAHTTSLFDVTSGSNGSCGGSYLCTAKAHYDGPTGLGTPNGTGAF